MPPKMPLKRKGHINPKDAEVYSTTITSNYVYKDDEDDGDQITSKDVDNGDEGKLKSKESKIESKESKIQSELKNRGFQLRF